MKQDEMLLLSNQQHLEYFCILFPRACQRLISGIQTVTRGPVGPNTISVCGTVMSDEQSEVKQTAFSIQIVHSEYWSVLMYPAIELGLIINSFYYNTGSWQPPKSLSRHQRSRSRSTTSSPTESAAQRAETTCLTQFSLTHQDLLFQSLFSKEHRSKMGCDLKDPSRSDKCTRGHTKSFDTGLTTPLKQIRFGVLSLTHTFFPTSPSISLYFFLSSV